MRKTSSQVKLAKILRGDQDNLRPSAVVEPALNVAL
jgi:hypothetical protein